VQFWRMNTATDRNADRQWNRKRTAGAGAHARGMTADLVIGRSKKSIELNLWNWAQSAHRQADRGADDSTLCERCIHHALLAEALLQAFGDAEDSAVRADILAKQEDARVLLHLLDEGEIDCLDHVEVCHRAILCE